LKTFHPDDGASVLYPRQPASDLPSNISFQPSAFSAAVSIGICACPAGLSTVALCA
jgi:hypothetical protein